MASSDCVVVGSLFKEISNLYIS